MRPAAAAAGTTKRPYRSPSRYGSADASRMRDTISKGMKGSGRKRSGPFSLSELAGRHRAFGVLDRGACLGDFQRDAAARIARAGQAEALGQCHRLAIDLHMGALVVFEKSDDELSAVRTMVVLEGLRPRRRRTGRRDQQHRTEN